MKIYRLLPKNYKQWKVSYPNFGQEVDWAIIVIANNETEAREYASSCSPQIDGKVWSNKETSTCERVVLSKFKHPEILLTEMPWGSESG